MKKLLLSLFAVVATTFASVAEETLAYTCEFKKTNFQKGVSSYTDTWTTICDGYSWTITNFNNNNKGWDYIKCGSKNNASVASITTAFAAPEKVSKVIVTIDAITATSVNSIKLQSSATQNFSTITEEIAATSKAKGELTLALNNPTGNLYYRLVFDCAKGSSNGLVQVSKILYYATPDAPAPDKEETTLTWAPESNTLALGETFTAPALSKPEDAIVEYTSDNESLLSVDSATGEMTLTSGITGTANVTAKIAASDPKYYATPAVYTLTVYDPDAPVALYSSSLGADFSFSNPASLEVWKHDNTYGLKGSAFISSKINVAEAIAISPVIDLTEYHDVTLDFKNAFNNYKVNNAMISVEDFAGYAYVVAKEENSSVWEDVCEATAPASFSWTFFDNATVSLEKFAGKKVQFGFKYVSTTQCAGTWEVQEIVVKAKAGAPELKAPVISVSTSDGQQFINDGEYTIAEGTAVTVTTTDAQNITIKDDEDNIIISEDAASVTWTPASGYYMPTVTATNAAGSDEITFLLTVTGALKDPELAYAEGTAITGYAGTEIDEVPELINRNNLTVTYSSSNESIVEVFSVDEDYMLILKAEGKATITATFAGDDTYAPGSASYDVTVLPGLGDIQANSQVYSDDEEMNITIGTPVIFFAENAQKISYTIEGDDNYINTQTKEDSATIVWSTETVAAGTYIATVNAELGSLNKTITIMINVAAPKQEAKLSFSQTDVTITEGSEFEAPVLTTDPEGLEVTYESSNTAVATIGEGNEVKIAGVGTTTITATFAGNDNYYEATASYTLTVRPSASEQVYTTTLTASSFGVEDTSYSDKEVTIDGITYEGCIAGDSSSTYFSIRNSDSKKGNFGGIAVTVNNLKVATGVTITQWKDQTSEKPRKAFVYGSYDAFTTGKGFTTSNISDKTNAVKLGEATMAKGEPVDIVFDENEAYYPYIIILSDNTLQMTELKIDWIDRFENPLVEFSHNGKLSEGGSVTFTMNHNKGDKARIYYMHETAATPTPASVAVRRAPAFTDQSWNELADTNPVEITSEGKFHVYASDATGRNRSSVVTSTVKDSGTTGISEVTAEAEGDVEWYDLSGRRVAAPAKGVYIMKQGTKVSKRTF